jgi:hypothetical protein
MIKLHLPLVSELFTASVCSDLTFSGLPCTSCVSFAMLAVTFGKYQVYVSDSLAFSELPRISVSDCYAGGGGQSHLVSIWSMHPIHLHFIDSDYSKNIHMLITILHLRSWIYLCSDCLLRNISKWCPGTQRLWRHTLHKLIAWTMHHEWLAHLVWTGRWNLVLIPRDHVYSLLC